MAHKLILNMGGEEQVHEFADIEGAFNAAMPRVMEGYVARITDDHGIVMYTQALINGQFATSRGDATTLAAGATSSQSPAPGSRKPWWRFW